MKRSQLAWMLYDVASSGYVLLITAVAFPIYFKLHGTGSAAWSDALWGGLLAAGSILAAIAGPVAGVAADITGKRLRYLYGATLVCCVATAMLGVAGMPLPFLSAVFVISYTAYLVAANLYDSLLNTVTTPDRYSWLSGIGWGAGYVGGIACYLLTLPVFATAEISADGSGFAEGFMIVAAYYAVVAALAVAGMATGRPTNPLAPQGMALLAVSVRHVGRRLLTWRSGGSVPRLLVGANLITGAATALTLFTPLILSFHFGLPLREVTLLSALFSILAIPATLLASIALLRIPALTVLLVLSPLWLVSAALLAFGSGWDAGLSVAICLGLVVGPTNAIARAIVANSIAISEAGEMFGFAAFVNRLTSTLGPLFFGVLSSASSGRVIPVMTTATAIVIGLLMLPGQAGRDSLHEPGGKDRSPA